LKSLFEKTTSFLALYKIEETNESLRIVFRWPMRISRLWVPALFCVFSLIVCSAFFHSGFGKVPLSGLIWLIPMLLFALIMFRLNRVLTDRDLQFDKKQNTLYENGIAKLDLQDIVRMEWNLSKLDMDGENDYSLGLKMNNNTLFILAIASGFEVDATSRLGNSIAKFLEIPYIDNRMYIKEPVIWKGK